MYLQHLTLLAPDLVSEDTRHSEIRVVVDGMEFSAVVKTTKKHAEMFGHMDKFRSNLASTLRKMIERKIGDKIFEGLA